MGLMERQRGFPPGTVFEMHGSDGTRTFRDFAEASREFAAAVLRDAAAVELIAKPPGELSRTVGLFGDCGFAIASSAR